MKVTINECQFVDSFEKMNRKGNFSYEGKKALFAYFTEYELEMEIELELDVIAICSEFSEYDDIDDFNDDYDEEFTTIEEIKEHTQVIPIDDESFIIQDY